MSDTDDQARGLDPDNIPDESGAALHTDAIVGTGLSMPGAGEEAYVYPGEGQQQELAVALNDAAAEEGLTHRVQWQGDHFVVPQSVADKASLPDGAKSVQVPEQGASYAQPLVIRNDAAAGEESDDVHVATGTAAPAESGALAPAASVTPPGADKTGTAADPRATKPDTAPAAAPAATADDGKHATPSS